MDLEEAAANFARSTLHCVNLIEVHHTHGANKRGFRSKEPSLNRAVIVLAVASWQAVVQDLSRACIDMSTPPASSLLSPGAYGLLTGRLRDEIDKFNTPNAENTRKLLNAAGYDPFPHWSWTQADGRAGRRTIKPSVASTRLNEWLSIRHAIAHGDGALPQKKVLDAVRYATPPPESPGLHLKDAERCLGLIRRLAHATGRGLALHLAVPAPPAWRNPP